MNSEIHVRAITTLPELQEIEGEWNRLWARCPNLTTFQSWDWVISWIEAFAPCILWVLEARRDEGLVGLAPLFIYGTSGDRIVAPLGAGISDYLDVLVEPDFPEALDSIFRFVWEHASEWTELHFPDLPRNSLLLQRGLLAKLQRQQSPDRNPDDDEFDARISECDFCPQLRLPASIDELRTVVPAKRLRNLRTARRQLDGAEVELATKATLDEFLGALFRLHQKRWQLSGEAGVLSDPRVRQLHRLVTPRLMERGVFRLFGLRYRGALIACLTAFFERDAARLYMQGYDPEWARSSPGAQLIGAALEQAIREQKRSADFMRGRETYKYYWGCRDVPTFQLRVVRRTQSSTGIPEKSAA